MTNGIVFCVCSTSAISALFAAPKNLSLLSCTERMPKRMQEQSEENRIVAKFRPVVMKLTSSVATGSSSVDSPIASRSPGILKASSGQVGLSGRLDANANHNSPSRRSVEFSRMATGCSTVHQRRETCGNGQTGKDQKSLRASHGHRLHAPRGVADRRPIHWQ